MKRVDRHRKRKRELEIAETIRVLQQDFPKAQSGELNILEFGAGACDQVDALQQLGRVTAMDIYTHERVKGLPINFIECSITDTPFSDKEFDIIYANHVIAHIGEARSHGLDDAFGEMKRIGKSDCLYIFSVPTPLWLWLSIPAHYYTILQGIFRKLTGEKSKINNAKSNESSSGENGNSGQSKRNWIKLLLPQGLGTYRSFAEANRGFRLKSWVKLFENYGLTLKSQYPLAVYSASEFPIVPTFRWFNKINVASSRLLVFNK